MLKIDLSQKIKIESCPVCTETSGVELYRTDAFAYQMCSTCGYVFLADQNPLESLAEFYNDGYESNRHDVHEYEAAVARLERKDSYSTKATRALEFESYLSSQSKVLEIGAGYGTFLKALTDKFGATVSGIEPGQMGSRVGKEHYKLDVVHGTLESELSKNSSKYVNNYDCVVMVHVLEHLQDPLAKLKDIRTVLNNSGILYIAVPNLIKPDEALEKFFHDEHLSYFSPYTLGSILKRAGFSIVSCVQKPKELVMIASVNQDLVNQLDIDGLKEDCLPSEIIKLLSGHQKKYSHLRSVKSILSHLLPKAVLHKLSNVVAGVLRSVGILRV